MTLIADSLLGAGALGAAVYCLVLSRRLQRFAQLESGMGGAIAVLSAQVDDMTRALKEAQETAVASAARLEAERLRAEAAARRIELLLAALHDLPEGAGGGAGARPRAAAGAAGGPAGSAIGGHGRAGGRVAPEDAGSAAPVPSPAVPETGATADAAASGRAGAADGAAGSASVAGVVLAGGPPPRGGPDTRPDPWPDPSAEPSPGTRPDTRPDTHTGTHTGTHTEPLGTGRLPGHDAAGLQPTERRPRLVRHRAGRRFAEAAE